MLVISFQAESDKLGLKTGGGINSLLKSSPCLKYSYCLVFSIELWVYEVVLMSVLEVVG